MSCHFLSPPFFCLLLSPYFVEVTQGFLLGSSMGGVFKKKKKIFKTQNDVTNYQSVGPLSRWMIR